MAAYIPTLHSKIRYYERVEESYSNRDETIRLAKKYGLNGYFLHAKKLCFHNLSGSLKYLNNKEFIAPLFKWEVQLINKLNGGN